LSRIAIFDQSRQMSSANPVGRATDGHSVIPLQRQAPCVAETSDVSLTAFALSTDADLLWPALLRWPDLDRGALCARAGIDNERAGAALEELVERGFAQAADTAVGVAPVDPKVAIEHVVSVEQRELGARLSQLSDLRALLPALAEEYERGRQRVDKELPIEVVDGIEATRARVLLLARSTRVETLNMDVSSRPQGLNASRKDDLALLNRGISARTIVQSMTLDDEEMFNGFALLAAAGEQIRVIDQLPARMVVADREVAVLQLDPQDIYRGAIIIRLRIIVDLCVFLFERVWREATPMFEVHSDAAPSGRPTRVLELMAAGRKDEAIARALGVGVRTVRRDIAGLMAQLGEHTRAATVAAAMRRGWLTP
jgi:DNA-binding CsgD family transcriptional regulator